MRGVGCCPDRVINADVSFKVFSHEFESKALCCSGVKGVNGAGRDSEGETVRVACFLFFSSTEAASETAVSSSVLPVFGVCLF